MKKPAQYSDKLGRVVATEKVEVPKEPKVEPPKPVEEPVEKVVAEKPVEEEAAPQPVRKPKASVEDKALKPESDK